MPQRLDVQTCPGCGGSTLSYATYCSACGCRLRGRRRRPPSGWAVLGAVLLILCALPLGLVGGGCTIALVGDASTGVDAVPLLAVSLAMLAGAIGGCVWAGRLLAGRPE